MRKFKNIDEFRQYNNEKAKAYYEKNKIDPGFIKKRREYQRSRYHKMMNELKSQA